MKKVLFIIACVFTQQSYAACSQNDMSGKWWIVANSPAAVVRCVAVFSGSSIVSSKSSCVIMMDSGGSEDFIFEKANFTVRSDCRVAISVTDPSDGSVDNGYGWMTRDGEVIVGATQNSGDGSASSVHAVKMY